MTSSKRWYIGAAVLLVLALVFRMGLLAYAMYVLLGLLIITRLAARLWIEKLTAKRKVDKQSAQIGETVSVQLRVTNAGKIPVPWVILEDVLERKALLSRPPRLRVDGKRLKIAMLKAGGETKLRYELTMDMRGYYQIGPLVLESGDLFGLHRRYRVATEPSYVLVYPKVIPLEGYDLASRRPIGEIRIAHKLYEDPTRIAGVRYYQAGDPLNRIHWRATARTATLHSKVYEPSTIAGATVLLDFHQGGYHERGEPYRSELAVTAAATLTSAVYQLGQQVGLVTNGRDALDRIRTEGWEHDFRTRDAAKASVEMSEQSDRLQPLVVQTRRGPEQLMRIMETLARVELTDGLSFAELVIEASSRLPRDATIVAILGSVPPETALALGGLARRGYAVTAILVCFEDKEMEAAYGRLIGEGVEVRHFKDEMGLAAVCRRQVLR
jgi:uncharacterized repeat protein (TIGR01451 family)